MNESNRKMRRACLVAILSALLLSASFGCQSQTDPTLTAAPPVPDNAKPAKPAINKDRGEEASSAASGPGASSEQATTK